MCRSHAHREARAAGALDELDGLIGVGEGVLLAGVGAVVLLAADFAELGLDGHAHGQASLGDRRGHGDVLLEGHVRAVDHDRGVAYAKGLHAAVVAVAVVEVQGHGDVGLRGRGGDERVEVLEARVLHGAWRGLHDDGGLALLRGGEHGHDELEVLDVERADGVVAPLSLEHHFLGGDKHGVSLLPGPRSDHPGVASRCAGDC